MWVPEEERQSSPTPLLGTPWFTRDLQDDLSLALSLSSDVVCQRDNGGSGGGG